MLADGSYRIPFLSDTYEGSVHDKPIAEQTPYPLRQASELLQDLGFVGFSLEGVQITMPQKKPRGKELSQAQKAENQVISHRRVRVEHIICSVKRCRIVKDTIRLWKDTARDLVMAICCGLHNFRVRLHPWASYQQTLIISNYRSKRRPNGCALAASESVPHVVNAITMVPHLCAKIAPISLVSCTRVLGLGFFPATARR